MGRRRAHRQPGRRSVFVGPASLTDWLWVAGIALLYLAAAALAYFIVYTILT